MSGKGPRPMFWPKQAQLSRRARLYVAYQAKTCSLPRERLNAVMNSWLGVRNP